MEALHEGRHIKTGEHQEVVDKASQKGRPRVRRNKTIFLKEPNPWPRAHDE
jgi:hypothetical protein